MAWCSEFLQNLEARGFIHQITDGAGLDQLSAKQNIIAYVGFDATAPSLHVGNLLSIMMLRHFQKAGHKPIILLGGGTTKIGDPSGKDQSRQLLATEKIQENIASIQRCFANFLNFTSGDNRAIFVNNAQWLDKLHYIPFLRDIGKHFSINRMLGFESVKRRLEREQFLSFLEFNYMILQAYDFLELSGCYNCVLQMGGSDQWGNIVSGIDLISRMSDKPAFGLTTHLLTTSSGAKMGKTAQGAVWLDPEYLSSWEYWQFWRNCEDADTGKFLRLFTDLPLTEIQRLEALEGAELNEAKKILANQATALAHGQQAADQAAQTAREVFEQGQASSRLPHIEISSDVLAQGLPLYMALKQSQLAESHGAAKRLIQGGGVKVNDVKITETDYQISLADSTQEGAIKLSAGKRKHALIKIMAA